VWLPFFACCCLQALPGQALPEQGVPHFKLVLVGDGGTGERGWEQQAGRSSHPVLTTRRAACSAAGGRRSGCGG
jgi:hypothetical protein